MTNMIKFFKKEIQPLIDNLDTLTSRKIQVLHLTPMIVCEQNIDFGGRELLSTEFNNFLDLRKI